MPDAAPLLAAIASAPDDDLPRLVFADWLDEQGEADRGEFIRLQCHTARVGPLDPTWAPAKLREYDLFRANEPAWRPSGRDDVSHMLTARWHRGFPACVDLGDVATGRFRNGEWCNGAFHWTARPGGRFDPWPKVGPVREVRFSGWRPGCGAILQTEQLRTVRSISLMEWYAGVNPGSIENFAGELAQLPPGHFPELTTLDLDQGELNLPALEALAAAPCLQSLRRLDVRFPDEPASGEVPDWEAASTRLLGAVAPRLESLSLDNPTRELLAAFAAIEWPHLTELTLRLTYADDLTSLPSARPPQLRRLRLFPSAGSVGRVWPDDGVDHLVRWTAASGLKELCVFGIRRAQFGRLLNRLNTPELENLVVFDGSVEWSVSSLADLAERDVFANLKNLDGPFTHAALAALADPDVLPELHTIWGDDSDPPPALRWRGGVRTVIPKDPPDGSRSRPTRGSWCGGS